MIRVGFFILALCSAPAVPAEEPSGPVTVEDWVLEAQRRAFDPSLPERRVRAEEAVAEVERLEPGSVHALWLRAQLSFLDKEDLYLRASEFTPGDLTRLKLQLADRCHEYADRCVEKAPTVPECHLVKGGCFAMQASTWGVSLKALRVCAPMNRSFLRAMQYPSDFLHLSSVSTRQMAQFLRAVLYRVMPESWWFRFLAGVRGDKEQAYQWMRASVKGSLAEEPVALAEYGATAICYGREKNKPDAVADGVATLQRALALPTRGPLDDFDKGNIAILLERPYEACNYRRERFENLSDLSVSKTLRGDGPRQPPGGE